MKAGTPYHTEMTLLKKSISNHYRVVITPLFTLLEEQESTNQQTLNLWGKK